MTARSLRKHELMKAPRSGLLACMIYIASGDDLELWTFIIRVELRVFRMGPRSDLRCAAEP
ncbi:hypothetical protein LTS10_005296 [Elasticomyces elasticus]|nr:hypothetical protein LTS10_005296 [Elasticomyces elasticus]